jgi:hypothetical protein
LSFFNKVFGSLHPVTQMAEALQSHGVQITQGMYDVCFTKDGTVHKAVLSIGVSAMMKSGVLSPVMTLNKERILHTMITTWNFVAPNASLPLGVSNYVLTLGLYGGNPKTAPKAEQPDPLELTTKQKDALNSVFVPPITVVEANPFKKLYPGVVELREAQVLGQKVRGTSSQSVYHTVAVSGRVKLAARITQGGSISLRVECENPTADELKALGASEMQAQAQEGKPYWSVHFNYSGAPVERVIGAFIFGLGVSFDDQIKNGKELVIEGV